MSNEKIDNIINEISVEIDFLYKKIEYQNEDFICECCLETKESLERIQYLIEMLEDERL